MIFSCLYTAALQPRYISVLYFDNKAVRETFFCLIVHFFCLFKRRLPADYMLVHFAGRIDFGLVTFQGLVPFRQPAAEQQHLDAIRSPGIRTDFSRLLCCIGRRL